MTITHSEFRLNVLRLEGLCQFELSWGEAQCLTARLSYPAALDNLYRNWQRAYLNFYQSRQATEQTPPSDSQSSSQSFPQTSPSAYLRAHVVNSGSISPNITDWQAELSEAETALLLEFRDWLCQGQLQDIRKTIAAASRQLPSSLPETQIEVFLTCDPLDLVRLPWENWEITDDLAAVGRIRIVRSSSNRRNRAAGLDRSRRRRVRILAVCCDDVGLNLSREKDILRSLEPLVYIRTVGWASDMAQPVEQVRQEITQAICDPTGWDVLFFAGHSDETQVTGGKLAIAPNSFITLEDLRPALSTARQQGLQLAIFNSCSGLQIAETLLDLGLREVVVMRERIHNQVAQEFLVQFARSLRAYRDAQTAVRDATQQLLNRRLDYPSAYLVPSVFRRPGSASFRLTPPNWRQWLNVLLPQRRSEAVILALLLVLSQTIPLQLGLLDQRLLVQAWYRTFTQQTVLYQPAPSYPALALIRVDDASIAHDQQSNGDLGNSPFPISQKYLARLVQALSQANVRVIGIDYVLDKPDLRSAAHTTLLADTIAASTAQGRRFVFAKIRNPNSPLWMQALPNLSRSPNVNAAAIRSVGDDFHLPLQSNFVPEPELTLPYWLTWFHRTCLEAATVGCEATQFTDQEALAIRYAKAQLPQVYRPVWSELLDRLTSNLSFYLLWFHPITDFSLPPEQVYQEISAWKLLEPGDYPELQHLARQTAMITPGGYLEAGMAQTNSGPGYVENFLPPRAMRYWYSRDPAVPYRQMTGGEHLGYVFHHFLHQRFVTPVPDLLMVLLAALGGKLVALGGGSLGSLTSSRPLPRRKVRLPTRPALYLIGGSLAYGFLSLQLYVSNMMLLPILLPLAAFWLYAFPRVRKAR
ncbi:MAG: CHASE2 domain-containing protein [Elainella sp.]